MPAVPHHVKTETFDVAARTNTDPKGFVRPVDVYRVEPWGLYMARPSDHPQFHYLESWLLPELGLRVSIFHFTPGNERDQDRYVDVGRFWREGELWHSRDHFLDLVVRTGRETLVEDVDELFAAVGAGLLDADAAEAAVHTALRTVDGIAAHGYDLDAWLHAQGAPVSWR
ncbi:DUF402 domain-containing protein [Rhodococcus sp. Z13]|uniref:DUF402 domain-containing protein n=1 Tax=Rhodococcus sacchari TaxID=2962047 RepID=A0ACD4DM25_9NOCA|nr:DUF402 domain-containing protein [Rhodococcus sp. Z13]UYP21016.1 DUF402 domain-containing protein [Rhodococcus sp. Z13]